MAIEISALTGAALLAVAAGCSVAAMAVRSQHWLLLSFAARVGSVLTLAMALYLAAASRGGWTPLDLRQVALSLALATAVAHVVLSWAAGSGAGSPVADVLAAAIAVVAAPAILPGGESLTCLQRPLPYRAEWVLFVLGAGAIQVAGAAALSSALPWRWALLGARKLLQAGSFLALVAIGTGIVAGLWWTWQSTGTLQAGDIRESWMSVVWLLAAMSTTAWQLEKDAGRWAAALGIVAAGAALLGLLALPGIQGLLGV
jgi:hypothetical protein